MLKRSEPPKASDPIAAGLQIHATSCAWLPEETPMTVITIQCESVLYTPATVRILVLGGPSSVLRQPGCNLMSDVGDP